MEVTIRFSDQVGKELQQLPDRDAFVSQAVARALQERSVARRSEPGANPSKWARMVERVQQGSQPLGDYYQQFRKDMREFREDFRFKLDESLAPFGPGCAYLWKAEGRLGGYPWSRQEKKQAS